MTLLERVARGVVLADGAMGTLGFAERDALGPVPSMWPVEDPEVVEQLQREYVDAGAELILTCTFGASRGWLAMRNSQSRIEEINQAAVAAARDAADASTLVGGDVGPVAVSRPADPSELKELYLEQIGHLVAAGVDAIVLETQMTLDDARAGIDAANSVRGEIPLVVSMTFDRERTARDGASPEQFADAAASAGADIIGVNCCDGPRTTLAVVQRLAAVTDLPLFAKPSAGLPGDDGSYPYDPERFARYARRLVDAGARIVGGCCGTTPRHIAACRDELWP